MTRGRMRGLRFGGVTLLAAVGLLILRAGATARQVPADSYYYDGTVIPLSRSQSEVVVKYVRGVNAFGRLAQRAPGLQRVMQARTEGLSVEVLSLPPASVVKGQAPLDARAGPSANVNQLLETLRQDPEVEFVAPVFHHPGTGIRVLPTDELLVRIKPDDTRDGLAGLAASYGLTVDRTLDGAPDQFVLRMLDGKGPNALELSRMLFESGRVQWVEPNFIQEYQRFDTPNDPLFGQQWHLSNTGQGGGTVDADSDVTEAWDIETGQSSIVIAVLDDGLDKTHTDLAPNLFVNTRETPGNGIDDDANGKIDDISGWDFSNNDNDVTPTVADDGHGTAVAGVAAARGNNASGVAGVCRTCRILPVKMFEGEWAASSSAIANAITYAALFADVINNSWGGGLPSSAIQAAIQNANATGRGGKGALVVFASGNSASGLELEQISGVPSGSVGIQLVYSKDSFGSAEADTAWVPWMRLPGGEIVDFSEGLPAGWTTGGAASWTVVTDPVHSDEGQCLPKVAKAGAIGNGQTTYLQVLNKAVSAGTLSVYHWTSSEAGYDGLKIRVDTNNDGTFEIETPLLSGVPSVTAGVSYPAAHPESIAVGASSNRDCRSHYSQYGPELAFVAPSSAGPRNLRITTTDLTGAAGYDASSYTSVFGGTSSATPLASGIAALILSRNPNLSRAAVVDILKNTADKVGPEPYAGGRNDRYGHGRLNAYRALLNTPVVTNGDFSSGTTGWQTYGAPDTSAMQSRVTGGVFEWRRQPQTPGAVVSQGTIFQQVSTPLAAGVGVSAEFKIGNTSASRKYMKVLLVADPSFSDLAVCTFWLAPGAPLRTYGMQTHTTKAWSNPAVYFYASSPATDDGYYQLDDVTMQLNAPVATDRTTCIDPLTPAAPGGASGPNLVTNGDFGTGSLTAWSTLNAVTTQVAGGVLEMYRATPTWPPPVVLQGTGQAIAAGTRFTATVRLGNSSPVRKRVLLLVNDADFSDLVACTWWLEPNTALASYALVGYTSKAWANAMVSIYPSTSYDSGTPSNNPWIRVDDVTLRTTPSASTQGSTCLEPAAVTVTTLGFDGPVSRSALVSSSGELAPDADTASGGEGADAAPTNAPVSDADPTFSEGDDIWRADGFTRTGEPAGVAGTPSWRAVATEPGLATLTHTEPIDLRAATGARVTFASWLAAGSSRAAVQVSVDGVLWETVHTIAPSLTWMPVEVDLGAYLGAVVELRLVFTGVPPVGDDAPDQWQVDGIAVGVDAPGATAASRSAARPSSRGLADPGPGAVRPRRPHGTG